MSRSQPEVGAREKEAMNEGLELKEQGLCFVQPDLFAQKAGSQDPTPGP